jgi:hypothetical protein
MNGISRCFASIKKTSPVAALPGCGLLVIASARLAHAVTVTAALVWVYGLTTLVIYAAAKFFPRRGRTILISFLASFVACCYLFALWLASPLCALESFFAVSLVPVFYMASGVSKRFEAVSGGGAVDSFFSSFSEAFSLGVLLLAFALIREPLGFLSLSLPTGAQGSVLLFSFGLESFLPVKLISSSAGALLLLGYFWGLYKSMNKIQEEDKNAK